MFSFTFTYFTNNYLHIPYILLGHPFIHINLSFAHCNLSSYQQIIIYKERINNILNKFVIVDDEPEAI